VQTVVTPSYSLLENNDFTGLKGFYLLDAVKPAGFSVDEASSPIWR